MCKSDAGKFSILIVDDMPNWVAVIKDILSRLLIYGEYIIESKDNFQSAKHAIENQKWNLVVFDVRLRDNDPQNRDGLELVQMAKAQLPPPKIVLMTAYKHSIKSVIGREQLAPDHVLYKNRELGKEAPVIFKNLLPKNLLKVL